MADEIVTKVSVDGSVPQGVTLVTFADGGVAEVVTYVHENELQVTVSTTNKHGTTVTVDDIDVYQSA
jgi:hypothetical protein